MTLWLRNATSRASGSFLWLHKKIDISGFVAGS
jgi:hypothetical protein